MSFKDTTGRAFFLIKNHCFWRLFYVGKNYNFVEYFNRKTKRKMKQIPKIMLFCFILILSSCEKEDLTQASDNKNQSLSISNAKKWFEEFKATENIDPMFIDLVYNWNGAYVSTLTDGSKAITVPVIDQDRYIDYSSKKLLYLYPLNNEKEFTTTLFQLITNLKSNQKKQNNQDEFNLDTFDGYIINWDLTKGFVKGSKFNNSLAVTDIDVEVVSIDEIREDVKLTGRQVTEPIELKEVIVKSGGGTSSIIIKESKQNRDDGGSSGSGYINAPRAGGGGGGSASEEEEEKDPCEKLKILKEDSKHKNALAELKNNFKLQYETGYYISKSKGYVAGIPDSNLTLTGTRYTDSYGVMHVHEDSYTHQVNNGGIRPEIVTPIHMFSPKDVNTFCSLLITANKYKTSSLDEVFNEMVSSSGTYQLRFDGDIINVKNFNYDDLEQKYIAHMKDYLESGFLSFMKEYIGINGITLYKINEDGTSEGKTLSVNNQLITNPC
jgi:hypothetical protein